jgi:hypothetical protein
MKNFIIAGIVFVAVTYAIDSYLFHGEYYGAAFQVFRKLVRR